MSADDTYVEPTDAQRIAWAYEAFDAASWECERLDDDEMMDHAWMREAIESVQGTAGYPRAYKWASGAHTEGGEAIFFPGSGRLGVQWGSDPDWCDAESVRAGVRMYICDPATWALDGRGE